jgi:hypothetical protein
MTLTEQMKADGWNEHDGGPCPVDRLSLVAVRKRNGREYQRNTAAHWDWWHSNHPADIIAYRPEQHR